ncbi:MAG: hypothetical protein IPJ88_18315 [Myxococcales bacterium]|nr:MAG: hypothetical protein IPJ88_18315 [Myxococcales bacterium]
MKNTASFYLYPSLMALMLLWGCPNRDLRPLTPCVVSGVVAEVQQNPADKIDILFMIDNSNSMTEEQGALAQEFATMVNVLTTGELEIETENGTETKTFSPVTDMHIGVVSSDMGVGSADINAVGTCGNDSRDAGYDQTIGDDGLLQTAGDTSNPACAESYPSFLTYSCDDNGNCNPSSSVLASDFTCVAKLGVGGCGVEQQLESVLKALSDPAATDPVTFQNGEGHGSNGDETLGVAPGANAGFVRDDSLLAIIMITDEDDCSTSNPDVFTAVSQNSEWNSPLNRIPAFRCASNPAISGAEVLYPTQRYIEGLLKLREDREQLLVFAAITGVPQDLVDNNTSNGDINFDAVLGDNAEPTHPLTETEMLTANSSGVCINGDVRDALRPACGQWTEGTCSGVDPADQFAFPARRIVEVAKGLNDLTGGNSVVQSICPVEVTPGNFVTDFSGALTQILNKIGDAISGSTCLPRELNRNTEGLVNCDVVETLPLGETCESYPGRTLREVSAEGNEVCVIEQLVTQSSATGFPEGEGWFYDDFTTKEKDGTESKRLLSCGDDGQRVAFTSTPPANVRIRLECTQPVQNVDEAVEGGLGTPCANDGPCTAEGLACETNSGTCQFSCTTNADCASKISSAYVCDTDSGFCVNPTCN